MNTVPNLASPCAVPSTPVDELATAQLFACAENALSVALYHLRQPAANVPGAARKAVQALAALNQLRALPLEPSSPALAFNVVGG
ncbi:MAG: hypothetical protein QM749_03010 [Aquabacterium sp.]